MFPLYRTHALDINVNRDTSSNQFLAVTPSVPNAVLNVKHAVVMPQIVFHATVEDI